MSKNPKQQRQSQAAAKPKHKLTAAEKREINKIIQSARGDGKPHSAQDTLPFRQIYPDGLCKLTDTSWSRCIEFEDVNYQLARQEDQTAIFEALCDMYNAHDSSIGMELCLPCRKMNREDFVKRIEIAAQGDAFDGIRELYTQMLHRQVILLKKQSKIKPSRFGIIVLITLGITTVSCALSAAFMEPIFILNENQLLYIFSAMAQVIGGIFGLTLTAYVFFVDKFMDSAKDDDTYYDAKISLLKQYFFSLIIIAIICGLTIFFSVAGIITLHNWSIVYPFIIDESITLFFVGIVVVLKFGVTLLDPEKLNKELAKMKQQAEKFYQNIDMTKDGDFSVFLRTYNLLEKLIIDIAKECEKDRPTYYNNYRPQIIQSLKTLSSNEIITYNLYAEINELRVYRNGLVHGVDFTVPKYICDRISEIHESLQGVYDALQKYGRPSTEFENAVKSVYALTQQ